jgi:glutaminyl-tRNA synthetase
MKEKTEPTTNFIKAIIEDDIRNNKHEGRIHTRFPPEPNGYLHIGHAKSICLNFGIAEQYNGLCNLRFDDTNPHTESTEYVDSIKADIRWLGFDWEEREYYASDYFAQLCEWAEKLIKKGKAYVCDLSPEQIAEHRGVPTRPGKESPYRNRSVEENLELFRKMRGGDFPDGAKVLRAKIDMSSPNMHMRDPIMYRITRSHHHRSGDKWCIYPTYDYTHGQSDYLEKITHSLCTLEFEVHRPLYDWFLDQIIESGDYRPRQIEFARLNLSYTVMSKRKLLELVENGYVDGWDDPRMPTICGLKRRGYTPEAIRNFSERIGVAKKESMVDIALLEHCVRVHLNKIAPRVMAVLEPLKLIITNYPEGETEELDAVNNPEDESAGMRKVPFSKVLYIEKNDFMEDPPKKFYRLAPGREVRLRYAYFVTCTDIVKDEAGNITEIHCTYDPATKGGSAPDGRKVKSTLHWVSAEHALDAEVRLNDHLFTKENPSDTEEGKTFMDYLNSKSMKRLTESKLEPSVQNSSAGDRFQFERQGYFCVDSKYSTDEKIVFNRTVSLRDEWAKIQKKKNKQG